MRKALLLALILLLPIAALAGEPLSNEDVVKMVSAGLGEELVIAKIREAPEVDFALGVDDLLALKAAGVGERVVQAMLERNAPAPSAKAESIPPDHWADMQQGMGFELVTASLQTSEGATPLTLARGDFSAPGMGFGPSFVNYSGLHARIRTKDRRPSLLVKSSTPPAAGRNFLAKLDPDQDDDVRSLKVSSMRGGLRAAFRGNASALREPDPDWTIPFDVSEESPGLWRVTPKKDVAPGEYGWYVADGAQMMGLFGFGVD